MKNQIRKTLITAAAICSLLANAAHGCTGIRLIADDGTVVHARTLEFAIDIQSDVMMVPRGYARTGTTPDGKEGLKWKAKYASVGAQRCGPAGPVRRIERKRPGRRAVLLPDLGRLHALHRCRCRQDHCAVGSRILDPGEFRQRRGGEGQYRQHRRPRRRVRGWGFAPEAHYIVHDASGKSIVIEYVGGKLNVHDNPLGVVTNSPAFDWHMTNLRNYVNFSMTNAPPVQLGPVKLLPTGQGSGMLGLPGDFTPPSRFVRAVAFSQSVFKPKTGDEAVLEAFHVLNQFDIPKGAAREQREGRARQYPGRLHALDVRQRSQGQAVLLPHVRQQPDPHGRSDEDEPRRQGYHQDFDEGRGKHHITKPLSRLSSVSSGLI